MCAPGKGKRMFQQRGINTRRVGQPRMQFLAWPGRVIMKDDQVPVGTCHFPLNRAWYGGHLDIKGNYVYYYSNIGNKRHETDN